MKKKLKDIYSLIIKKIFDYIYSNLLLADNNFFKKNVEIQKVFLSNKKIKSYKIFILEKSRIYSDNSEKILDEMAALNNNKIFTISSFNNSGLEKLTNYLFDKCEIDND